jgi:hypothetical protein
VKYIVLVTGSRTWTDGRAVYAALGEILEHLDGQVEMAVMHGDCPNGADAIADLWCSIHDVEVLRRPADWRRHGKAAGHIRNGEMLAEILAAAGGDPEGTEALAFLDSCRAARCQRPRPHGSHGTDDMMGRVKAAGIPLQVFRPE